MQQSKMDKIQTDPALVQTILSKLGNNSSPELEKSIRSIKDILTGSFLSSGESKSLNREFKLPYVLPINFKNIIEKLANIEKNTKVTISPSAKKEASQTTSQTNIPPSAKTALETIESTPKVSIESFQPNALEGLEKSLLAVLPKAIKDGLTDLDKTLKKLSTDFTKMGDQSGGGIFDTVLSALGLKSLFSKKPTGAPTGPAGKPGLLKKVKPAAGGLLPALGGLAVGGALSWATGKLLGKTEGFEKADVKDLETSAEYFKQSGDKQGSEDIKLQVQAQKKEVGVEAAQTGARAVGYVAGNIATKKLIASAAGSRTWRVFVVYVKRKAPSIFAKIGVKLAAAAGLAAIPVVGWIGAAVNIGFSLWTAWDLYQLWKEFSALSDVERAYYADEKNSEPVSDDKLPKVADEKKPTENVTNKSPQLPKETDKLENQKNPQDLNALLAEQHKGDPLKNKNYDNIAAALIKQGATNTAEYEQAVKNGKIPKEFDEAFKKQYTRTSLGKEKGEEIFAQRLGSYLKEAQLKQAAKVSPDQKNYAVSGNITEGKKVEGISAKVSPDQKNYAVSENITEGKKVEGISAKVSPINVDNNLPKVDKSLTESEQVKQKLLESRKSAEQTGKDFKETFKTELQQIEAQKRLTGQKATEQKEMVRLAEEEAKKQGIDFDPSKGITFNFKGTLEKPVITDIKPKLQHGGIVPATPGGRDVTVAEGNEAEAIIPWPSLEKHLSNKELVSETKFTNKKLDGLIGSVLALANAVKSMGTDISQRAPVVVNNADQKLSSKTESKFAGVAQYAAAMSSPARSYNASFAEAMKPIRI